MSSIPTQESHDPKDPRQHLVWALRNMPMVAGVGAITHPGYLAGWSEHLYKCGFRHVDSLRELADENGNIHVSQLPSQEIKFQQPVRGQRHSLNPAARWVDPSDPEPQPTRIPNIKQMTDQENEAMIRQYEAAGLIPDGRRGVSTAEVFE